MPKCRNRACKQKLPKGTLPQVCDDACKKAVYAQDRERKQARQAARAMKPKPAKKKPKSIARLRNDVAELMQKLVRMKAADPITGFCQCVTCPKSLHWKEMQGGHFIERGRIATCLVEENVHPQCEGCNHFGMRKASVVLKYRGFMVDMYGEQFVQELEIQSKQVAKHTRGYLEDLAEDFKRQIEIQEQRLSGRSLPPPQEQERAA